MEALVKVRAERGRSGIVLWRRRRAQERRRSRRKLLISENPNSSRIEGQKSLFLLNPET